MAFRTQIEIQALQAFVSEVHYQSTQPIKIYACRRFNSLRLRTAISIVCCIQLFNLQFSIVDSVRLLCSLFVTVFVLCVV